MIRELKLMGNTILTIAAEFIAPCLEGVGALTLAFSVAGLSPFGMSSSPLHV